MYYPLHSNKLTHFKKNDTGILFRNNLKAILMDSSINIESILNEAILESNKLLQSETVDKNKLAALRQKIKVCELLIVHQKQTEIESRIRAMEKLVEELDAAFLQEVGV